MKFILFAISAFFFIKTSEYALAQECNPKDFTIQDIESIDFSDITKHAGYSLVEQRSDEEKKRKYSGSAVVYGVPISLSYDDSKSLSNFILQKSGFSFSRDTRIAIVRTALSSVGAAMYKDCLAAQSIKVEIPRQAYTEKSFNLSITWDPQIALSQKSVNYEIRVIGGDVEGKTRLAGKVVEKNARLFRMDKTRSSDVMQIDLVVHGQKYPSIVIPPSQPVRPIRFVKRYGKFSPPRNLPGNVCGEHAYLVAERGSSAGADTKWCRLCVVKTQDGILLKDTAEVEGQTIDAASKTLDPIKSDLEVCATFQATGRGRKGSRTEVRDGRLYVYEALLD